MLIKAGCDSFFSYSRVSKDFYSYIMIKISSSFDYACSTCHYNKPALMPSTLHLPSLSLFTTSLDPPFKRSECSSLEARPHIA